MVLVSYVQDLSVFEHMCYMNVIVHNVISIKWLCLQFVDSDNVLSNRETIQLLMDERLPIVSPMLSSRTTYSNFWSAINADVSSNVTYLSDILNAFSNNRY